MSWRLVILIVVLLILLVVGLFMFSSRRLDRENRALAQELLAAGVNGQGLSTAIVEGLPSPVANYLERAMPAGVAPTTARLEQRGEILQGGAWRDFTAVQHITAEPPGFVWDARISFAPLVEARVIDAYVGGEGLLRAKLLGTFTVADAEPGHVLDESELLRFLAEGPWLPTSLIPRPGVTWSAVDEARARVTLENEDDVASLVFTFDEAGDVVLVEGQRSRGLDGGAVETGSWVGRFWNHGVVDGVRMPMAGEVAWVVDGVVEPYWRGTVESVEFDVAAQRGGTPNAAGRPLAGSLERGVRSN